MKYGVFQKAIRAHLTEIPDYHISLVRSDGVFEPVVNRRSLYATGIIVHRESDGSLVSRSSLGSVVKQGMKVRVPQENLFKTYSAEGDTYLVGVFSYDSPQEMQIQVEVTDGLFETKEIAVSCWNAITWNNTFSVDDGEQFLYRIDSFSFDSDERKQKLEQFASSGTSVHGKKMLVIDLRNNWGGDLLYQLCFLSGLTSNVIYTPEKKEECVSYKDSFGTQLLSPAILQSMLFMQVEERKVNKNELSSFVECGLCGTAAVISPVGRVNDHGNIITFKNGCDTMGPVIKKLYDTLTGIQMGRIEAPKGWIYEIK